MKWIFMVAMVAAGCAPSAQSQRELALAEKRHAAYLARADRELSYHRYSIVTVVDGRDTKAIRLDSTTGESWIYDPAVGPFRWLLMMDPQITPDGIDFVPENPLDWGAERVTNTQSAEQFLDSTNK